MDTRPAPGAVPADRRDDDRDETAARVWHALRVLVLERHDRRKEVGAELGMSFIRVKALRRVAAGPLTLRALADHMAVDPPYTTVIVDDLERRGLVERTSHPSDRRAKLVRVTDEGLAAAERARRITDTPPAGLARLDPQDLRTLERVLAELLG